MHLMRPPGWSWNYSEPRTEGIQSDAGQGVNRGVTVAGDSVFYETDHAHLLAFNRFTGEKRWDVAMADYKDGYAAVSPPLPVGDLLIAASPAAKKAFAGFSMPIVSPPANASGASGPFLPAANPGPRHGRARRSSMDAVPPGCPAPSIPR